MAFKITAILLAASIAVLAILGLHLTAKHSEDEMKYEMKFAEWKYKFSKSYFSEVENRFR
jgi:hypothetical protein